MVKANELIKEQKKREEIKVETFKKVYKSIEKKIVLASAGNFYYVWYEVPEFVLKVDKECISRAYITISTDHLFLELTILTIVYLPALIVSLARSPS